MQQIPFSRARANLADTLRSVEAGNEPAVISRRGEPAAVLMSVAQFRRLSGPAQDFAGRLDIWRQRYLNTPDAGDSTGLADPWFDVRDPSPGRDFAW